MEFTLFHLLMSVFHGVFALIYLMDHIPDGRLHGKSVGIGSLLFGLAWPITMLLGMRGAFRMLRTSLRPGLSNLQVVFGKRETEAQPRARDLPRAEVRSR